MAAATGVTPEPTPVHKIAPPKKTIENQSLFESMFRLADNSANNKSRSLERKEIQSILNRYIDIVEK